MSAEIKIKMLNPNSFSDVAKSPEGVRVSGFQGEACSGIPHDLVFYFLVTVMPGVPMNVLSNWLYHKIINHRADCVTINGQLPKDRADFDRIVREQVEIRKND